MSEREQDRHPEIKFDRANLLQRRVAYAALRAEGFSAKGAAAILGVCHRLSYGYEARRMNSVRLYQQMTKVRYRPEGSRKRPPAS
jgi:hypothetical protein